MNRQIDVTAVLCVRNEESSLPHILHRLVRAGVSFAIIDHESSDRTRSIILSDEFRPWLVRLINMPFHGEYSQDQQLLYKSNLIKELSCDWVIHQDADEVLQSTETGETIHSMISRADRAGYNVVNFDEFVFLPIDREFQPDTREYQDMLFYYFFEPTPTRLMRAWKRSAMLENRHSGGHILSGNAIRLYPENMILRHYIFRNQQHALEKYTSRTFPEAELVKGWHTNRFRQPKEKFFFPGEELLDRLNSAASADFSRARPRKTHYWQWE